MSAIGPNAGWLSPLAPTPETTGSGEATSPALEGAALEQELRADPPSSFHLFAAFDRSNNLRPMAERLARDGTIDANDVRALVEEAKDFSGLTPDERDALQGVLRDMAHRFTPDARAGLWRYLGGRATERARQVGPLSPELDPSSPAETIALGDTPPGLHGRDFQLATVGPNDSYATIAERFGVSLSELLLWNTDVMDFQAPAYGQRLRILDPTSLRGADGFEPDAMPRIAPGTVNRPGVRMLQESLNTWRKRMKKPALAVNGSFDRSTRAALLEYQLSNEIPQTGIADRTTWRHLQETVTVETVTGPAQAETGTFDPATMPTIRRGSSNRDAVVAMKRALNAYRRTRNGSEFTLTGDVAGAFGPRTQAAVREFQYLNGLRQTGVVDAKTWAKLAEMERRDLTSSQKPVQIDVPWISQKDTGGRVVNPGSWACYRTSRAMVKEFLANSGMKATPLWGMLNVGTTETSTGEIVTTRAKADAAHNYIDRALDAGLPVHVGVSYVSGNDYNRNPTTDHYVVITGRGRDDDGKLFYTYNDPWPGRDAPERARRFYVDADGKLEKPAQDGRGNTYRRAEVSEVLTWRELP